MPTTNNVDCCAVPTPTASEPCSSVQLTCPLCGSRGKVVNTQTLKALLAVSLENVRATDYRFCRTESCSVVYFSTGGEQTFTEIDLREPVHQKHPMNDDVFVCYCFRHTPGTIRTELLTIRASTVIKTITDGLKSGQCACDIRNPQGDCCLGNVQTVVKQILKQYPSIAIL